MNQGIKEKAEYCLNCKTKPCSQKGCPLNNDIPAFINAIKEEKYKEAYKILTKTTVLPAICGRICPHYKQCMGSCVRGIKGSPVEIGTLEAFIGDLAIEKVYKICLPIIENNNEPKKAKNIAIIGGGPAGLTAAAFLSMEGHKVTIYEKYDYLGGLLVHGIPEFRLTKETIRKSVDQILKLGIKVKYNQELGRNTQLQELEQKYDNIILAFGANVSLKMGIQGEGLDGVYGGNELLEYNFHPDYTGKTVIVNGGGNVAMDTSRTIKRLGAKRVIVVYRRSREQMPAEQKEIEEAINEGVEFLFQNNIVKIIGENKVEKIELVNTELVKKEGETRLYPMNIENSNYQIDADFIVMAIGSHPSSFVKNLGLELNENGYIKTNENGQTSNPKIYAIGDLTGNKSTVAWASSSGRNVAEKINLGWD